MKIYLWKKKNKSIGGKYGAYATSRFDSFSLYILLDDGLKINESKTKLCRFVIDEWKQEKARLGLEEDAIRLLLLSL